MKHLVWLRNDLRMDDNPALYHASQQGWVEVVFIACPEQWRVHNESDAKIGLKADLLVDLSHQLAEHNIPFHLLETEYFHECAALLDQFCQDHQFTHLWFNQEIPVDELARDQQVYQRLSSKQISVQMLDWDLLCPQPIYNQQGTPFKVFTPFYKAWQNKLQQQNNQPLPKPKKQDFNSVYEHQCSVIETPIWKKPYREDLWQKSKIQINEKLENFCHFKIQDYMERRDIPSIAGTSTLSPYLALGVLGPRHLINQIQLESAINGTQWQHSDWLRELAWRDFYKQLMWHFPKLCRHHAFKENYEGIRWNNDEAAFQAWCEGKTGFPIIDAAMRQLQQTGWMHNRLRMLTASFLTKLLFIDWRKGEEFFMQNLIDGDFAANNGGWQWSASTGCDSVPYFRIFNPITQSRKFDPEGEFIRIFVPELTNFDKKNIHDPNFSDRKSTNFPSPLIDYHTARNTTLEIFKNF